MERGGLASLCFNIRATHASLSNWSSGTTWQHRRALSLPCIRPCHYIGSKGYLNNKKGVQKSSLMASSSESREVKLEKEELLKTDKLLIDCGDEDQECVIGGIVALGKFDALHIGHRHLAIHASKAGTPFLLSFVGMAEVLGWEPRPPIVAKRDRKRVLETWAPFCGDIIPVEYQVEFSKVRYLTPRQFVEKLSDELRVSGVVAGENYRFGYKASGDASELVKLCKEFNLQAFIVSSVMDNSKAQKSHNGSGKTLNPTKTLNPNDKGQVSSSRVRHALSMGEMDYVSQLLGRKHRLVMELSDTCRVVSGRISVPKCCVLNQAPVEGLYENCTVFADELFGGFCRVLIGEETVQIELKDEGVLDVVQNCEVLGIEFG